MAYNIGSFTSLHLPDGNIDPSSSTNRVNDEKDRLEPPIPGIAARSHLVSFFTVEEGNDYTHVLAQGLDVIHVELRTEFLLYLTRLPGIS
jgi:hypothetical protein